MSFGWGVIIRGSCWLVFHLPVCNDCARLAVIYSDRSCELVSRILLRNKLFFTRRWQHGFQICICKCFLVAANRTIPLWVAAMDSRSVVRLFLAYTQIICWRVCSVVYGSSSSVCVCLSHLQRVALYKSVLRSDRGGGRSAQQKILKTRLESETHLTLFGFSFLLYGN